MPHPQTGLRAGHPSPLPPSIAVVSYRIQPLHATVTPSLSTHFHNQNSLYRFKYKHWQLSN